MKKLIMALLAIVMMSTLVFAEDVYITKKGKKFHKKDCVFIQKSDTTKIDDKDAIAKGLKPCGKCLKPDEKVSKKK